MYENYTDWKLRQPPHHVRVMIKFEDGGRYIGYSDGFGYLHLETGKIVSETVSRPLEWKKIEKDEWGNYVW